MSITNNFQLHLPDDGSKEWGEKLNANFIKIDELLASIKTVSENLNITSLDGNDIDFNEGNIGLGTQRITFSKDSIELIGVLQIVQTLSSMFDSLILNDVIHASLLTDNSEIVTDEFPLIITNPLDSKSNEISILITPTDIYGQYLSKGGGDCESSTLRVVNATDSKISLAIKELLHLQELGTEFTTVNNSDCEVYLSHAILYDDKSNEFGVLQNPIGVQFTKNSKPLNFSKNQGNVEPDTLRLTVAADDQSIFGIVQSLEKISRFSHAFGLIYSEPERIIIASIENIHDETITPLTGNNTGSINTYVDGGIFNTQLILNGTPSGNVVSPIYIALSESTNSYATLSNYNNLNLGLTGNPLIGTIARSTTIPVSIARSNDISINQVSVDVNRGNVTDLTQRLTISSDDFHLKTFNQSITDIVFIINKLNEQYKEPAHSIFDPNKWINLYAQGYVTYSDHLTLTLDPPMGKMVMCSDPSASLNGNWVIYTLDTILDRDVPLSSLSTIKFFFALTGVNIGNVKIDCNFGFIHNNAWVPILSMTSAMGDTLTLEDNIRTLVLITHPFDNTIIPRNARISIQVSSVCPAELYHVGTLSSVHILPTKSREILSKYTIISSSDANGTITPLGVKTYEYLDIPELYIITPNPGFIINRLLVNGSSISNPSSHTNGYSYQFPPVASNSTIFVTFTIQSYRITTLSAIGGSISPVGMHSYSPGSRPIYTFTANSGYVLESVIIDGNIVSHSGNTYQFPPLNADRTITATFTFSVTVTTIQSDGGTISPSGVNYYTYGATPQYTFTPNTGIRLVEVNVNGDITNYSQSSLALHTLQPLYGDAVVSARFAVIELNVSGTVENGGLYGNFDVTNGGLSIGQYSNKNITIRYGTKAIYYIYPKAGYTLHSVKINGESVSFSGNTYTIDYVTSNTRAEFIFSSQQYSVEVIPTTITVTPSGTRMYDFGARPTYTFTPPANTSVTGIFIEGQSIIPHTSNIYTFDPINKNIRFNPVSSMQTVTVTGRASAGGTITPNGTFSYAMGSNILFTITPNNGYKIDSCTVNKVAVQPSLINITGVYGYSINNIKMNYTCEVSFVATTVSLTVLQPEIVSNGRGSAVTASVVPLGQRSIAFNTNFEVRYTISASGYLSAIYLNNILHAESQVGLNPAYILPPIAIPTTVRGVVRQKIVRLNLSVSGFGSVSPSQSSIDYAYGESPTYVLIPNAGRRVGNVTLNGTSILNRLVGGASSSSINVGALTQYTNTLTITFI
jgi:hypothetical protein